MYFSAILSVLLASNAFAGPLSKLDSRALSPYRITSLDTYNVEPLSSGIIHMDMYVYETNPADNTTRHCRSEGTPNELKTGFVSCTLIPHCFCSKHRTEPTDTDTMLLL